jgi:hypothetical protein
MPLEGEYPVGLTEGQLMGRRRRRKKKAPAEREEEAKKEQGSPE